MRFENRMLEEWLEEKVTIFYICSMAAKDVIAVSSGKNYLDVVVKWHNGEKWFVRCFPFFMKENQHTSIISIVEILRSALILKAKPCICYIYDDRVEIINDMKHFANAMDSSMDVEKAAA